MREAGAWIWFLLKLTYYLEAYDSSAAHGASGPTKFQWPMEPFVKYVSIFLTIFDQVSTLNNTVQAVSTGQGKITQNR